MTARAPRSASRIRGAALATIGVLLATHPAAARSLEYLYIDANVGSASGGHAALQLDDYVFHFQYHEPGILRLERDRAADFRHRYGVLENRTIQVSRVEVDDETYQRLRDRFAGRLRIQERQIALGRALDADVALLERLRDAAAAPDRTPAAAPAGVPIVAAGYFLPAPGEGARHGGAGPRSAALDRLRARGEASYGAGFLAARTRAVDAALAALGPWPADAPAIAIDPDRLPVSPSPFALRYVELMTARSALEVLATAPPLRSDALLDASGPEFALAPAQIARLVARADRLEDEVLGLLRSRRPDWGRALLVGMARLSALRRSASQGRLLVLDVMPEGAGRVGAEVIRRRRDSLAEIGRSARATLAAARDALLASEGPLDRPLARLEVAAARSVEIERGLREGSAVRFFSGLPAPSRPALRPAVRLRGRSAADLDADLEVARVRARDYARRLKAVYAYDLFTANCVSQIFAEIDHAFEAPEPADAAAARARIRRESERRLGGYVEMDGTLNFIPFVSDRSVRDQYRVAETRTELSRRRARVEAMRAREPGWWVGLRESNTLTSTVYRRHPDDSFFLFFTDDRLWLRPLMGVANLVAGLGETLSGVAWLPFDRGHTLRSGLTGALFSLPELFFFNIRKGRLEAIPRVPGPPARSGAGLAARVRGVAAEGSLHAADGGEHVGTLGQHGDAGGGAEAVEGAGDADPG